MEVGLIALGWTIAICVVVGLLLGYAIGHTQHKEKGKAAAEEAVKAHEDYREEVHEHFQQTSQIMSRMVDDYREMYQHLSAGAGKLANIHPERVITPPPAPEAITDQGQADAAEAAASEQADEPVAESADAASQDQADASKAEASQANEDKANEDKAAEDKADADKPAQPAADTATDKAPAAVAEADQAGATAQVDADEKARARRLSGNPA